MALTVVCFLVAICGGLASAFFFGRASALREYLRMLEKDDD